VGYLGWLVNGDRAGSGAMEYAGPAASEAYAVALVVVPVRLDGGEEPLAVEARVVFSKWSAKRPAS
jgi:hypothetical protein